MNQHGLTFFHNIFTAFGNFCQGTDDPLEGMDLPELPDAIASKAVVQSRAPARRMEELPGLPSMDESEDHGDGK